MQPMNWSPSLDITLNLKAIEELYHQEIAAVCSERGDELQKVSLEVPDCEYYRVVGKNELELSIQAPSRTVCIEVLKLDTTRVDAWDEIGTLPLHVSLIRIHLAETGRVFLRSESKTIRIPIISPYARPFSDPPGRHEVTGQPVRISRENVLRDLRQKIEGLQQEAKGVLWLYGVPQCGKTSLIQALENDKSWLSSQQIMPVCVHLEDMRKVRDVRKWRVVYWLDQAIDQAIAVELEPGLKCKELPKLRPPSEYATDIHLDWSRVFHSAVSNCLGQDKSPHRSILLILDGIHYFSNNHDFYRALAGLFELVIKTRRGQSIKVLTTDVLSFEERMARLERWRAKEGKGIANIMRRFKNKNGITEFRVPLFDDDTDEIYELLQRPFDDAFPASRFSKSDAALKTLRNQTAGHPALLKAVFHRSTWLYERGERRGDLAQPRDAFQTLAKLYNSYDVLDDDEKRCLARMCQAPDRPYQRADLDCQVISRLAEKGLVVQKDDKIMLTHWYAVAGC